MKISVGDKDVQIDNERGETVILSIEEVASLATNAHNILDKLALRGRGQGQFAVSATRSVTEATVSLDTHASEVVLILKFSDETKIGYAIPPNLVSELIEALTKKLDEIETAKLRRTTQ